LGNIATERVLEALSSRGAALPIRKSLDGVLAMNAEIATKYGA
jgi:hypothetical protein